MLMEKKTFNRVKINKNKNNGRNLRKSHRGGITLPGYTDMQQFTSYINRKSDTSYM